MTETTETDDRLVYLSVDAETGVGTIRLNRPPMNALNAAVQTALAEAAEEATADPAVRAVVVYGGEKLFAAGADIKEMQQMSYEEMVVAIESLQSRLGAIAAIPKPTIAAITGFALGGGLEVTLACDFRIASDKARLGVPEVTLGLLPGGGGTQRLARLIGPAKAKDLLFTGRQVRADEALAIGLVDAVVPAEEVYAEAVRRATAFAAGPSYALRAIKACVDQGLEVPLASGLGIERQQFAGLFASNDSRIGMQSFVENGPGKAVFH